MRQSEKEGRDGSSFLHQIRKSRRQTVPLDVRLVRTNGKAFVAEPKVALRHDTGMAQKDKLPQWMEQQLLCSLYSASSAFYPHCPMSIFLALAPNPTVSISDRVCSPPALLLRMLCLRISSGNMCPEPVGTEEGVLRSPACLSRKQPSPPFQGLRDIYCLLSRRRWDLTMLTLLLKWPPAGSPFRGFMMKSCATIHPPTCAPQIFKLGLHKHGCAGEMIPGAVWSEPAAL